MSIRKSLLVAAGLLALGTTHAAVAADPPPTTAPTQDQTRQRLRDGSGAGSQSKQRMGSGAAAGERAAACDGTMRRDRLGDGSGGGRQGGRGGGKR